jgi:benzil reductase ((S)-benzoin forming)
MDKSLLILTGHTHGIGRAILDIYLKSGEYQILAISRTSLGMNLPNLTELSLDLDDLTILENKLADLFPKETYQKIILINNAGWIGEIKPIGKLHPAELRKQINVNLLAPMYLTNAFITAYQTSPSQKIICNISSGAASKPVSGWGGYCSTKAALAMFTMVAAQENQKEDFIFFSLAPGVVDTDMQQEIREVSQTDFPDLEKFKKYHESGELSSPEIVAKKIAYLLNNPTLFTEVVQDVRKIELP